MAGFKSRFIVGLALVVLALPAMAAAQSSTFIVEFNRTGTPGTATVTTTDPLTGQPITMIVDRSGRFGIRPTSSPGGYRSHARCLSPPRPRLRSTS